MLIRNDLRILYSHARDDSVLLTEFLEKEVRVWPRQAALKTLSMYARKMEMIKEFFESQNIDILPS
jgi:hypothetical protein